MAQVQLTKYPGYKDVRHLKHIFCPYCKNGFLAFLCETLAHADLTFVTESSIESSVRSLFNRV